MGCRILTGEAGACFHDSVTDVVFGPLFESKEEAQALMGLLSKDPRTYSTTELVDKLNNMRGIVIQ